MGSAALDLAWTAAGRYDAFYERGVQTWDIAAGVVLCEAAGLRVRAARGGRARCRAASSSRRPGSSTSCTALVT